VKLRPDTPQDYEDIHYRDITLAGTGRAILNIAPWRQFFDLKGQPPPKSIVKNVSLSNIKGSIGGFGQITGTEGQTEISDFTLENIDVKLDNDKLDTSWVKNLTIRNVTANGKPIGSQLTKQ
jgi:hypothetical protein